MKTSLKQAAEFINSSIYPVKGIYEINSKAASQYPEHAQGYYFRVISNSGDVVSIEKLVSKSQMKVVGPSAKNIISCVEFSHLIRAA